MTADKSHTSADLQRRTVKLGWLLALSTTVAVAALALSIVETLRLRRTVASEQFVLVDGDGQRRAVLENTNGTTSLTLLDASGRSRVQLQQAPASTTMVLLDVDGNNVLAVKEEEGRPSVSLKKGDAAYAGLELSVGPWPSVVLGGSDERIVLSSADPTGPRVQLTSGARLASLGVNADNILVTLKSGAGAGPLASLLLDDEQGIFSMMGASDASVQLRASKTKASIDLNDERVYPR